MDIQEYVKEIEHLLYAAQDPTKRWVDGHHAVIELIAERDALRELLNDRTNDVEHEYARAEAAEARVAELKAWSAAWKQAAKDYRFRAGRYYSSDVRHCKDLKRLKAEQELELGEQCRLMKLLEQDNAELRQAILDDQERWQKERDFQTEVIVELRARVAELERCKHRGV